MVEAALNRTPVSVITGFLGSGKTTLINYLVSLENLRDTALIINEFGEIGLDHILVESSFENTLLLENGCICCSIRGDLVDTISDLFTNVTNRKIPAFSRIIIETTGLADPRPIVISIDENPALRDRVRLDSVISTVISSTVFVPILHSIILSTRIGNLSLNSCFCSRLSSFISIFSFNSADFFIILASRCLI